MTVLEYNAQNNALRLRGSFCRNRFCHPCSTARAALIAENLTNWIARRQTRFLTLTLKHRDNPLGLQITRIWKCFKALRATDFWQRHVSGFAAFIEVKHSSRTHCWHVHLHILAEGMYVDQRQLSRAWLAETGDSAIVDVRAVTDPRGGARYAAKYASKPGDLGSVETDEDLRELITELGHRRLWQVGGSWKGRLKLLAKPPVSGSWEFIADVSDLLHAAAYGDKECVALLMNALCNATEIGGRTPNVDVQRPP